MLDDIEYKLKNNSSLPFFFFLYFQYFIFNNFQNQYYFDSILKTLRNP